MPVTGALARGLRTLRLLPWVVLAAASSCADAAPKTTSGPRHRVLLKVAKGTFAPELETRLEAELLLALRKQPDLEVISLAVADSAARRRHVCVEENFAPCRDKLLGVEGELSVELQAGAVPGTWVLDPAFTPTGGVRVWQSTLPFSPQNGETLEEATARSARQLGGVMGPTGLRAGTSFEPATKSVSQLAAVCDGLNDPRGIDLWSARDVVRAHLHQAGQDHMVDEALAQLKKAGDGPLDPCARLSALDAWRSQALSRGWLPEKLPSLRWHANVKVVLRGSGYRSPLVSALLNAVGGALATRGFTFESGGPAVEGEPCVGADCLGGQDVSDVTTTLGLLVVDVVETPKGLKSSARFFLRNRRGQVSQPSSADFEWARGVSTAAFDEPIEAMLADALKESPELARAQAP